MDLRSVKNERCFTNCNKEKRKEITDGDLCKVAFSEDDKLPLRCVGEWAYEKIFRLNKYFGIFTTGMHKKWKSLNYIEICSGPGRCIQRDIGEEIDGTALSILQNEGFKYIDKAIFIDLDDNVINVLKKRINSLKIQNAKTYIGNYREHEGIDKILNNLNPNSLNIVFIDPTDCSVPFETIKFIKNKLNNIDLIFNFAYGTDLMRNIRKAICNEDYSCREKYTNFLGEEEYFNLPATIKLASTTVSDKKLFEDFLNHYIDNLKKIGLKYTSSKLVKHYYMLLYASASSKGLEFWKKSQEINPNGQREFYF
jgi:three-Cys-motif partner protein